MVWVLGIWRRWGGVGTGYVRWVGWGGYWVCEVGGEGWVGTGYVRWVVWGEYWVCEVGGVGWVLGM